MFIALLFVAFLACCIVALPALLIGYALTLLTRFID